MADGGPEHTVRRRRIEPADDDDAVRMAVGIERRADAVDEGHRAEPARLARHNGTACAQAGLRGAQEAAPSGTLKFGVAS